MTHSNDPSNFHDVGLFHEWFGLDNTTARPIAPRPFNPELMKFRLKFLREEFVELLEALHTHMVTDGDGMTDIVFDADKEPDHAGAFDALLDIVYVAMGTAHFMGYPWHEGWDRVQQANMNKVRASDASESKRGTSFDVVKPDGWMPPDIAGLLRKYGWHIPECPATHPTTGNPCLNTGDHDTHQAMGEKRLQLFGDNLQEGTK